MAEPIDNLADGDTLVDEAISQEQLSRESMEALVSAMAKQKELDEQRALEEAPVVNNDSQLDSSDGIDLGASDGIDLGASDGIDLGASDGIQLDSSDGIDLGASDGIIFNDVSNEVPNDNLNEATYASAQEALDAMGDSQLNDSQNFGYDDGNYTVIGNENNNTTQADPTANPDEPKDDELENDELANNETPATSMENIGKAEFLFHAYNYAQNNKAIKNADGWVYHFYNDTFGSAPSDAAKNEAKMDVAQNPREAPDFFLEEVHVRHQQYHQNLVTNAFQGALSKLVDDKQRKQVVSAIKDGFLKSHDLPKNITQNQKNHAIASKVVVSELGDYAVAKEVIDKAAKLSDTNTQKEKLFSPFYKIGKDTADAAFAKLDFGNDATLKESFKQALDKLDKPTKTMAIQSALGAKGSEEVGALMADSISKINPEQSELFVKELGVNTKLDITADPKADAKADPAADPKADAKTDPAADPKADAKTDPAADPKADAKTDPAADPKADTKANAKTDPAAKPNAEKAANGATTDGAATPDPDANDSTSPSQDPDTNTDEAPERNVANRNTNSRGRGGQGGGGQGGGEFTPESVAVRNGMARTDAAARAEHVTNAIFGGVGGILRAAGGGLWDTTKASGRATARGITGARQGFAGQNNITNQANGNNGAQRGLTTPTYQTPTSPHPHIVANQTNINNYATYMDGVRAGRNEAPTFSPRTPASIASLLFLRAIRQPIPRAPTIPRTPTQQAQQINTTQTAIQPKPSIVNPSQDVNVTFALNGNAQNFINTFNNNIAQPAPVVNNIVNTGQTFTQVNGNNNSMSPLMSVQKNLANAQNLPNPQQPAPSLTNVVNTGNTFTQVNGNNNSMSPLMSVQKNLATAQNLPNPQQPAPSLTNVVNTGQTFTQVNGNNNSMSPLMSVQKNLATAQNLPNPQQPAPSLTNVVNTGNTFTQVNGNNNSMSPLMSVQKNLGNVQNLPNPQQPNIVTPAPVAVKKQSYFDGLDADSPAHKMNDKAKIQLMKLNDYNSSLKALPTDGTPLDKTQKSLLTKTAHNHLNALNSFRLSLDASDNDDVKAFNEVKNEVIGWHKDMSDVATKHGVAKKDPKIPNGNSNKLSNSLESTGKALSSFFNSVGEALKKLTTPKAAASNSPKP